MLSITFTRDLRSDWRLKIAIELLVSFSGPPLFRDGVCERRGPHVPNTAFREVQGARGRVSQLN